MYPQYIWIGIYVIVVWIGTVWWKLQKQPKDYSWWLVLATPALLPFLIPLLLTGSVFYNMWNIFRSPVAYLVFAVSQVFFVIPATPPRIAAFLGGKGAPEAVQFDWTHTWQIIVVLSSFALFLLVRWTTRRGARSMSYQLAIIVYSFHALFLFDILVAQIIQSWWLVFVTIGSFIVGLYIDEFRKRYLTTSTVSHDETT